MELGVSELAAVAAIYVLAGSVKGAIGLGLPTVSMALLGIWLPVEQAAAILILPAFLTNVWQSLAGGALRITAYPFMADVDLPGPGDASYCRYHDQWQ